MELEERQKIINTGAWAKGLKKDEQFIACIEELYEVHYAKFLLTASDDKEQREAIYMTMKGVDAFEAHLNGYIESAKVERHNQEEEKDER